MVDNSVNQQKRVKNVYNMVLKFHHFGHQPESIMLVNCLAAVKAHVVQSSWRAKC